MQPASQRILLIDDNASIHADFRKILGGTASAASVDAAAEDFFGAAPSAPAAAASPIANAGPSYEIDSALQGEQALALVQQALREKRPYALVFCDVRMPPGWDGVKTLEHLFAADPHLQAVLCTAFSDYTYEQTIARLGRGDRFLILKKPFDPIEVQQLAATLVEKWCVSARERKLIQDLRASEQEARAYAASVELMNMALRTDKATAEAQASARTEFLLDLTDHLGGPAASIERSAHALRTATAADAAAASAVRSISWSALRLCDALAEARLYAKLEQSDAHDAVLAAFEPAEALSAVIARLEPLAQLRGVEIRQAPDTAGSRRLLGDRQLVEIVASELVRFAIVESQGGAISVHAQVGPSGLSIELRAAGARIAPDELSSSFEPFGGSEGLALALSRRAAQRLGGDVEARCDAGGLSLSARLPMMPVSQQDAA